MRISFDLDDTLICYGDGCAHEPQPGWFRRWLTAREPLCCGAVQLMHTLGQRGYEVWIYTTSGRSARAVRWWLWSYGVHIHGVINQATHDRVVRRGGVQEAPSKNPAMFGIAMHVDDLEGVRIEGERHGFAVVVVRPDDATWTEKVLRAVAQLPDD